MAFESTAITLVANPKALACTPWPYARSVGAVPSRPTDRRVTLLQIACIIPITIMAVATGLALRSEASPVVSTAAAAAPAAPRLTVTPISTITVTPIEVPSAPAALTAEVRDTQIHRPSKRLDDAPKKPARKKVAAAVRVVDQVPRVEHPRRDKKGREVASERRAKIDVSNCVSIPLGCLKMEKTAPRKSRVGRARQRD
jgi:hypothetical protein